MGFADSSLLGTQVSGEAAFLKVADQWVRGKAELWKISAVHDTLSRAFLTQLQGSQEIQANYVPWRGEDQKYLTNIINYYHTNKIAMKPRKKDKSSHYHLNPRMTNILLLESWRRFYYCGKAMLPAIPVNKECCQLFQFYKDQVTNHCSHPAPHHGAPWGKCRMEKNRKHSVLQITAQDN